MQTGIDIVALAQEIKRQGEQSRDFIAQTSELRFQAPTIITTDGQDKTIPSISVPENGDFVLTEHAQGQLAGRMGIPNSYFNRMRDDAPGLLEVNVSHWMRKETKPVMVRTLDGGARAVMSDRYLRVDNAQIAEAALPPLLEGMGDGTQIIAANVTGNRLYIQARFKRIEGEVRKGDPVQMGVIITNSEIGLGAVDVRPMIYRLVCTNGMVSGNDVSNGRIRRTHVGGKLTADEGFVVYKQDTLEAQVLALTHQIRDHIEGLADGSVFQRFLTQLRAATEGVQVLHPVAAVEELARSVGLRSHERESVLESLIRGQDYSRYGMLNAVTAAAHKVEDFDRNVELQELGGRVLTLSPTEWRRVAEAEPKLRMAA